MTPERLAEIRERIENAERQSLTIGYRPSLVRELLDHIANLEAQRGELARELDLTKREAWTAKERHKDEKDRADGLRERLDELNADEFVNAQPIPADRLRAQQAMGEHRRDRLADGLDGPHSLDCKADLLLVPASAVENGGGALLLPSSAILCHVLPERLGDVLHCFLEVSDGIHVDDLGVSGLLAETLLKAVAKRGQS